MLILINYQRNKLNCFKCNTNLKCDHRPGVIPRRSAEPPAGSQWAEWRIVTPAEASEAGEDWGDW